MKKRQTQYLVCLALGGLLLAAGWALWDAVPLDRMLMTLGGVFVTIGGLHLLMDDPKTMRREEIEDADERNVAIRRRAKALSGDLLLWGVIAAAWAGLCLGAPRWVTLTALGLSGAKLVLDIVLTRWYQRRM